MGIRGKNKNSEMHYPTIGPAPCEDCPLMEHCAKRELACRDFYSWVNSQAGSYAKLRAETSMLGKPTKRIYEAMMKDRPGRPRKAA